MSEVLKIKNGVLIECLDKNVKEVVIPDDVISIGDGAFEECKELTSIIMPKGLKSIGKDAFFYCGSLSNITIPDGVTRIGYRSFAHCKSLKNITIPNTVTKIEEIAFLNCASLTSIIIPDSVTEIGKWAFADNALLTSIIVDKNNKVFDSRDNCNAIIKTETNTLIIGCQSTIIPNTVTTIGNDAFYSCTKLTNIIIPDSVTNIKNSAFFDCCNLKSITIPNSITTIGEYAFNGCESLTNFDIPNKVKKLNDGVFFGCSSLKSITIPKGVKSIGDGTFASCESLTSITIPNTITSIGYRAFFLCSSLTNLTIPNSVTKIGIQAIGLCDKLETVTFLGTQEQWENMTKNALLDDDFKTIFLPSPLVEKKVNLYKELLKCAVCGNGCSCNTDKGIVYHRCLANKKFGNKVCDSRRIREDILNDLVRKVLVTNDITIDLLRERIDFIEIGKENSVMFHLKDEKVVEMPFEAYQVPIQRNHLFSRYIKCGKCGKYFIYKTGNTKHFYICTNTKDSKCNQPRVREDAMINITKKVLNVNELNESILEEKLDHIECNDDNLVFHLTNGKTINEKYVAPSRSESWTDDMKDAIRAKLSKNDSLKIEDNKETIYDIISNNITFLRKKNNIQRKDFAEAIYSSEEYILNLETGKSKITTEKLFRIASFFNISPVYFLKKHVDDDINTYKNTKDNTSSCLISNIEYIRLSNGLTKLGFCKMIGLTNGKSIDEWRKRISYPSIETLEKIALQFNVPFDYLFEYHEVITSNIKMYETRGIDLSLLNTLLTRDAERIAKACEERLNDNSFISYFTYYGDYFRIVIEEKYDILSEDIKEFLFNNKICILADDCLINYSVDRFTKVKPMPNYKEDSRFPQSPSILMNESGRFSYPTKVVKIDKKIIKITKETLHQKDTGSVIVYNGSVRDWFDIEKNCDLKGYIVRCNDGTIQYVNIEHKKADYELWCYGTHLFNPYIIRFLYDETSNFIKDFWAFVDHNLLAKISFNGSHEMNSYAYEYRTDNYEVEYNIYDYHNFKKIKTFDYEAG